MFTDRYNKNITGTAVTDERHTTIGAGSFKLNHDTFFGGSDFTIRTAASGGGTKLTETTDYVLENEDTRLSTEAGKNVYTTVRIVNGTYQSGDLYFTYKTVGDYAETADINAIKLLIGKKNGLEIYYYGSDDIRVRAGAIHINDGTDRWVEKATETQLTGESGLVDWNIVTIDEAGTIQTHAATGTNAQRPTNSYYQPSGYNYDKQGYYFDADERIIGAIYRVNATSYYIINNYEGLEECGQNLNGFWNINKKGEICQYGVQIQNTAVNTAWGGMYNSASQILTWPVAFAAAPYPNGMTAESGTNNALVMLGNAPTTSSQTIYLTRGASDSTSRPWNVYFNASGRFI